MGHARKYPDGVEQAASNGARGESVNVSIKGEVMNPYSYGTPCFWVWYGADKARKELTK